MKTHIAILVHKLCYIEICTSGFGDAGFASPALLSHILLRFYTIPVLTMAVMSTDTTQSIRRPFTVRSFILLILIGVAVGVFSGLFGVGGGTVMVPGLMLYGLSQREASATSLAAMPLASLGGVVSYALDGHVNWIMGALIVIGTVCGSLIGSQLLQKLSEKFLRWAFVVFLVVIIVQQFLTVPTRVSHVNFSVLSAVGMIALGLVSGMLSALLGVGGGAILVPGMSALFGASDLVSRGTSLLAMMPGAVSATISNMKARLVDVKAAGLIGVLAMLITPAGAALASYFTPQVNVWVFNVFLALVFVKSVMSALKVK
ncbi:sulfite exporter TauE/SafE family protein [Alloscardovia omnicolens]|uniref:sulfite exporter TauE/SafE family protein n=1 Tax=Alloscardovia omnicolens TaxID=419015 RepID=UPI003A7857E0